ncbi:NtrZ family periplasmic regulatory protein [Vitreimonas sp.]|uniref:NtrZ family periplasmic regulatory protein n=1 Tax=Vitreimonas sp. TaxID=3069702 RepID=UPI002ED8FB7B
MFKGSAFVIAGAAVLATAGVAHAQDRPAAAPVVVTENAASRAAVPWYQRFTTSNGVTETITGDAENDRALAPTWALSQRWGVTLDVREAQRIERLPESRGDQTSVGAFYQFTPSVRVGGEVSVETAPALSPMAPDRDEEPRAGVRVESAFRF